MIKNGHALAANILVIGDGRLAKHLLHWCQLLKIKTSQWSRQNSQSLSLQNIDYIWLAISDDSLISFYENQIKPILVHQKVIHFSGTVHHDKMIAAHPLMTFSHRLYELETYNKIFFGLTGAENLSEALPGFTNSFFKIKPEDKTTYHALCVTAGNLPQLIWSETQSHFTALKVPEGAVKQYLQQSLTNFFDQGPKAVTGPIVRRDRITIQKNLSALEKISLKLKHIYQSFLEG